MHHHFREDDANWPKKNIVGKQELEIRVGNDHIAFEVSLVDPNSFLSLPHLCVPM
jgi:Mago nashi protein